MDWIRLRLSPSYIHAEVTLCLRTGSQQGRRKISASPARSLRSPNSSVSRSPKLFSSSAAACWQAKVTLFSFYKNIAAEICQILKEEFKKFLKFIACLSWWWVPGWDGLRQACLMSIRSFLSNEKLVTRYRHSSKYEEINPQTLLLEIWLWFQGNIPQSSISGHWW